MHVSLISPMMRETDKYGVLLGLTSVAVKYFCRSFKVDHCFFCSNAKLLTGGTSTERERAVGWWRC